MSVDFLVNIYDENGFVCTLGGRNTTDDVSYWQVGKVIEHIEAGKKTYEEIIKAINEDEEGCLFDMEYKVPDCSKDTWSIDIANKMVHYSIPDMKLLEDIKKQNDGAKSLNDLYSVFDQPIILKEDGWYQLEVDYDDNYKITEVLNEYPLTNYNADINLLLKKCATFEDFKKLSKMLQEIFDDGEYPLIINNLYLMDIMIG